jgi:hypothetical protein
MSFYSTLVLAANHGVGQPSPDVVCSVFRELGLLVPVPAEHGFGNLADDIIALFEDRQAQAENRRFFCPDTIDFGPGVQVEGPDGDYAGPGWSVRLHGQGYLFPWEISIVRERVVRTPKLVALRAALQDRLGGRFIMPPTDAAFLRERLIDGEGGWAWFVSESM